MYPRLFELGPVSFPAYGMFAALALIAGLMTAMRGAQRVAVPPDQMWNAGLITIFSAVFGARLLLIFGHLHDFLRYPLLMLSITSPRTLGLVLTELGLGACAGLGYVTWKRLPWLPAFDAAAPAFAIGESLLALGCFFSGCEYGRATSLPWAVTFHSRWALLWNGTPLGVPLHPVQLYFCAIDLAIFFLLVWWLPRRRQPGEVAGIYLLLAGLARFFLGFYRGDNRIELLHGAVSLSQFLGFWMVILGGVLLLERRPAPRAEMGAQVER